MLDSGQWCICDAGKSADPAIGWVRASKALPSLLSKSELLLVVAWYSRWSDWLQRSSWSSQRAQSSSWEKVSEQYQSRMGSSHECPSAMLGTKVGSMRLTWGHESAMRCWSSYGPRSQCVQCVRYFRNPYRAPRPTETQNPPAAKKKIQKTRKPRLSPKINARSPKVNVLSPKENVKYF